MFDIINKIERNNDAKTLSVVLRHSDRDPIPASEFGNEVLLNEQGIKNAVVLGQQLNEKPIKKIYTSPILRCVQTASKIQEGLGTEVEIILSKALGDPGLHISDAELAGKSYMELGFFKMYDMYIRGEHIPGVPTQDQINNSMLRFLEEKTEKDGLTLFITHDSVVAFFLYAYDKTIFTKVSWVDYLDGFCIAQNIEKYGKRL